MAADLPLAGRLIVEHVRSGASEVSLRAIAMAGRIAGDLGATVVRLLPASGDPLAVDAASHRFLNGGKALARESDGISCGAIDVLLTDCLVRLPKPLCEASIKVVVSHGVPEHLGIPDESVTDTAVLALSGILDLIGDPGAPPVAFGGNQASGIAGLAAFSGMVAALAKGGAETVHISALDACLWSNWKSYAERLYLGRSPTRQGLLAEWQAVRCADGYATLIFLEKDWPAVCRMIGEDRLSAPPFDTQAGRRSNMAALYEIARPWYRERTRAEIYALARKEGLPISPVLSVGEVIDDAQFAAQRFFVPAVGAGNDAPLKVPTIPTIWNGRRFPPRASRQSHEAERAGVGGQASTRSKPLAGCRVLDLGIITAGASTSAMLADLGADVIKVESSAYIDPFRSWDRGLGSPDWWNQSRFFQFTNRNKRGVAVDLKHADGKALFLDLVAKADVVVENFRRGVLERLGLSWDVLSVRNPKLILCSITSQGETGPDAGAASYGSTLEANSGLSDLTRDASGAPLISGILLNYPDQIVSIYAAGIVTLAIMEQRQSGRGGRLDISQRELASFLIGEHILAASAPDGALPVTPSGQPHFVRNGDGKWMLRVEGGHAVPVRNGHDLLAASVRGETRLAFAKAPDGSDAKGAPFTLDGMPFAIERRAPELGQHNVEVLRELLGFDDARIAALAAGGIIGRVPVGT